MVAILARLKLRLWRASLAGSRWRLVGLVVAAVYGLGGLALWWGVVLGVARGNAAVLHLVGVLGMSVLGLLWLFGSLVFFGTDETLDPSRFALLPVPAARLMPGLLIGGLLGLPGLGTVAAALVLPVAWVGSGPAALAAAVLAVPLGVGSILLVVRATTSGLGAMLTSRRFRDVAAVLVGVVAICAGLLINLAMSAGQVLGPAWPGYRIAAGVLRWTPFGAAWAVPGDVAAGRWGWAAAALLTALAWFALLWAVWQRRLEAALVDPGAGAGGGARASGGRGIERLVGTRPAGAIAVRCLRYWRRDPRYLTSLISFPLLPVIILAPVVMTGGDAGPSLRLVAVLMGLLFGASIAADISYDSSALWVHVASGVRGVDDRRGRAMAAGLVIGPVLVAVLAAAAFVDDPARLPGTAALLIVTAFAGAGVGSTVGAYLQGIVPQPGESAFARGGGGGLVNLVVIVLTMLGALVVGLPTLVVVLSTPGRPWLDVLALALAVGTGLAGYLGGTALGGRRLDARWPEVLQAVTPT